LGELTHIGEATSRESHGSTCHEYGAHNQKVRVGLSHRLTNLLHKREHDEGGNSVTDERRDDQDETDEDEEDAVQTHALDLGSD
jgi:hypothetical protein